MYRWLTQTSALILGQRCAACAQNCAAQPVCVSCTVNSHSKTLRCQRCAIPLQNKLTEEGHTDTLSLCNDCINTPPAFDRVVCVGEFNEPLNHLIAQFKFAHRLILAPWFATQLAQHLTELNTPFDYIIPIPLHPNRLRERGFNQAWEIIRHLPYLTATKCHALERLRDTPSQRTMNGMQRFSNVKNAFALNETYLLNETFKGQRILLVDDVITTTATVQAASLALKQSGVAHITVACLARVGM